MPDLTPDEFARHGHAVVDWIADYLAHPERYPVLAKTAPGDISRALPASAPAHAESIETILRDFNDTIVPGITHWNHPSFFAYFAISASIPGILGEMLTAALDVNAMVWKSSPAAVELELRTLEWLRKAIGIDGDTWFGVINDTASISTMLALVAARENAELDVREKGLAGRSDLGTLRIYCSELAHSSVDKGAITVGFGHDNVVKIPVDEEFRMRADILASAIADDRAKGMIPVAVVATVGTTSVASVDPVPAIADICEREKIWLHVDASYAGPVGLIPEMRHHLAGVDRADSIVVNPHKWLFTPVDCSAFWVRDQDNLKRAFTLVPEYLVTNAGADAVDLMDYGVQLGRRFRALKLWMVMRAFGTEGLAAMIAQHCAMAREFADWIDEQPDWKLVAPVHFSLVCFRFAPEGVSDEESDELNAGIMRTVNDSGEAFLSHTRVNGRYVIRLAIGNIRTQRRHLNRVRELLTSAATNRP